MNYNNLPPIPKMSTGIERMFKVMSPPGLTPVIYQEFLYHFIHKIDPRDGTKLSSKLDKTIPGFFYKEAAQGEHSPYGEHTYTFPDGVTRRLIALPPNTHPQFY